MAVHKRTGTESLGKMAHLAMSSGTLAEPMGLASLIHLKAVPVGP